MDRKRAWLIFHNLDAAKISLPPGQIMDAIRTIAEMPTHATINKFEVVKVIWYLLDTHNAQSATKEELIDVIKVLLPAEGERIGKEKNQDSQQHMESKNDKRKKTRPEGKRKGWRKNLWPDDV